MVVIEKLRPTTSADAARHHHRGVWMCSVATTWENNPGAGLERAQQQIKTPVFCITACGAVLATSDTRGSIFSD